ncbi:hypothetical protein NQ317_012177 [Molorchus minor]|uniref:Uncharacterized protein n=1 Tax=Molorchus minor TaxID=1323400 RepID=A0ABQ9K4D0_9CUCU|nr:hypothetical protein NQ317_012177 [Molorchus minor]
MVHQITFSYVTYSAQVTAVWSIGLMSHHMIHQIGFLSKPSATEVARIRPCCRVFILCGGQGNFAVLLTGTRHFPNCFFRADNYKRPIHNPLHGYIALSIFRYLLHQLFANRFLDAGEFFCFGREDFIFDAADDLLCLDNRGGVLPRYFLCMYLYVLNAKRSIIGEIWNENRLADK